MTASRTSRWICSAPTIRISVLLLFGLFSSATYASTITRTSSLTHDASTGLITSETIEPTASDCNGTPADTTSCAVTTTYVYDTYGNRETATVSGADITSRTTTTNYDSNGQFNTSSSNALNQSESWQYDPRFGEPTSHTGPNGLTTTWSYDTFGRVTQETRPDGTITKYAYINCSTTGSNCVSGAAIAQSATAYAPGGSTQIGPTTITYYDSLSRKVAVTTQGFDGSTIEADIKYDANGRVAQTSRPYFANGGTPKWTVNTYDAIGRVTHVALPNGGTIDTAYHGLSVSVTNDHGQTTTTVKNAQGLVASVTDAAGHATNYSYDAEGDLTSVTDPYGNVTVNTYDRRGNKLTSSDPDMGAWRYSYDVLGEMIQQTDAKGQTTGMNYDVLGRITSTGQPDQVNFWYYDTATNGIGKLAQTASMTCTSVGLCVYVSQRTYTYDSLGRPSTTTANINATNYAYTKTYDSNGRLATVQYPSGTTVQYVYTSLGYLSQIKDAGSGVVYWTANARDAELHPVSQTFGNGVTQTNTYDPNTGLLTNVRAGANDSVAAFDYTYDTLGNLTYRSDNVEGTFEYACYDSLNRLTQYAVGNGVTSCTSAQNNKQVTYDALGNITAKTGIGSYSYSAAGSVRPHAVASITGTVNGVVNPTYSYDADGNLTAGGGRTVAWTSYNMVSSITEGTTSVTFAYGARHQRVQQTMDVNGTTTTTTYIDDAASGAMEEKAVTSSSTTWHDYFVADGHIVAEKFSGATSATRYFILDHLGSVAVVTDESGTVVERDAYDAWGKRRNLDGSDDTACALASQTTRGFTNQEEIDAECLVNLNARLYDPALGRFMSADTIIPDPFDGQSYNRYSYVDNSPLSLTDPTGHDAVADTSEGKHNIPPALQLLNAIFDATGDMPTSVTCFQACTFATATDGSALGDTGFGAAYSDWGSVSLNNSSDVITAYSSNGTATNGASIPYRTNSQSLGGDAQMEQVVVTGSYDLGAYQDLIAADYAEELTRDTNGRTGWYQVAGPYEPEGEGAEGIGFGTAAEAESAAFPRIGLTGEQQKVIDTLLENSKVTTFRNQPFKGGTFINRTITGTSSDAEKAFQSLNIDNVQTQTTSRGIVQYGYLDNSTVVNVRPFSGANPGLPSYPTLEFVNSTAGVTISIRFVPPG